METQQQVNITQLTNEALGQELKNARDTYKELMNSLKDDMSSVWQLRDNIDYVGDQINELEIEQIRREEGMSLKELSELEEIAKEAYRKIRRMENYDWDVVEHSSEENKNGFFNEIHYLEQLATAANQEINAKLKRMKT